MVYIFFYKYIIIKTYGINYHNNHCNHHYHPYQ